MNETILSSLLNNFYWYSAIIVFTGVGLWEVLAPIRTQKTKIYSRWTANILLLISVYLILYLLHPILSVTTSLLADAYGVGFFNLFQANFWVECLVALLVLDFANYCIHRFLHTNKWTWSFHRVHHSDMDVDLTTGLRFHPIEAIFSAIVHGILIVLLGFSAQVVVIHLILVVAFNLFTHGNVKLHSKVDHVLSVIFITPRIHVIHHTRLRQDHDSNYGNIFSIWDRALGTLTLTPSKPIVTGLKEYQIPSKLRFFNLFLMPFQK